MSEELVLGALAALKTDRVLPFRFLAAARNAPQWEEALEQAMFRALDGRGTRLAGHTVLLVDVSGSMEATAVAAVGDAACDAAYGLAILLREIAEKVTIYTFSEHAQLVPSRRGMALRDALDKSQAHAATYLGRALAHVEEHCRGGYRPPRRNHRRAVARSRRPTTRKGLRDQRGQQPQRRRLRRVDAHRRLERGGGGLHRRSSSPARRPRTCETMQPRGQRPILGRLSPGRFLRSQSAPTTAARSATRGSGVTSRMRVRKSSPATRPATLGHNQKQPDLPQRFARPPAAPVPGCAPG